MDSALVLDLSALINSNIVDIQTQGVGPQHQSASLPPYISDRTLLEGEIGRAPVRSKHTLPISDKRLQ